MMIADERLWLIKKLEDIKIHLSKDGKHNYNDRREILDKTIEKLKSEVKG